MLTLPGAFSGLCVESYQADAVWDHHWEYEEVNVSHRKIGEIDFLVFRGTADPLDWLRDAEVWPVWHAGLGFVHAGFARHLDDVLAETKAVLGPRVTVTGHSLGGARARLFAALRVVAGLPVEQLCVFGSPKPGFANPARIIQKSMMKHDSWRNRNDAVPLVPGILPLWEHPEPWGKFDEHPEVNDFDPIRDHSVLLYDRGAKKITA